MPEVSGTAAEKSKSVLQQLGLQLVGGELAIGSPESRQGRMLRQTASQQPYAAKDLCFY